VTLYGRKVSTLNDSDLGPYKALLRRDLVKHRGIAPAVNPEHDAELTERQEPRVFGPLLPSPGCDTSGRGQQETNVRLHRFGKPAGPKFTADGYAPFDDLEKMQPPKWLTKWSKKKKSKKGRAKFHSWAFEDRRWWGRIGLDEDRITADLDEWLTAPCRPETPGAVRGHDLEHWWHCQQCRRRDLLPRLAQIEDKANWTKQEMDALDDVFLILECLFRGLNRGAGYRWQKFADQWETPCRLCSGVRRGGPWVNREDAHRSCWNELNRRQRRNRYVAIKSRSGATNDNPVVRLWDNGIRGTEPSVRAGNGSAPVPVFVSLHPQPLSTPEGTVL
jgi:hypothetical protein